MSATRSKNGAKANERRFSQEHYDMLKRCSEKKDMTEWNEWRKANLNADVLLEGANFRDWYLKGVYLNWGMNRDKKPPFDDFRGEVYLKDCCFRNTHLEGAYLKGAHLEGAEIVDTYLQDTVLEMAIVDGSTLIWGCAVNQNTDFICVGLEGTRLDPWMKPLLDYNVRRMNWVWWYKDGPWWKRFLKRGFVRPFWWVSDYGRSTARVIGAFFLLAFLFALVYWYWPKCVMVNDVVGDIRGSVHALYFSVVTMTTLGFGDIAANPESWCGQVLLMLQVILGYVLLGALVTRFAVLFGAGGPAGRFAKRKGKGVAVGQAVFRETVGGYHANSQYY